MKVLTTQTIRKFFSLMNRQTCDELRYVNVIPTKTAFEWLSNGLSMAFQ